MIILNEYQYHWRLQTIKSKVYSIVLNKSIAQEDKCVIIAEMKLGVFVGTNYQNIYTDVLLSSLRNKVVSKI
ncbi:hypothetical protein G17_00602 [Escherichia phage vB_EcoM_G17]|uniref:Uncharacterized protein n=1 Tax=Escherichia phage vB_Eco_slurp01 TaxID=1874688 RepID=A0A1C3S6T4_9CAUD|nr:hypothetical protein B1K96_15625 [Escherichia coli]QBO62091.1 hypothetical protein G17_00602 [Escherichia phage vB_EcoM_G17]WNN14328.1 hypothetical protein Sharanji_gp040 [Escherichia phage Sharanji]SCA80203.1 hypothetical protein PSLUR01_00226 [Escherichia phage vB_Eco_slurp01]